VEREFPLAPLVGVGAVVVDERGRVLLIKRGAEPGKGRWSLPGGLVELGEPLREAVVREVKEETGLIVQAEAVVDAIDRIYRSSESLNSERPRIQYHCVVIDYWCRILSDAVKASEAKASSDASEVAWIYRAEWSETNLYSLETIAVQVIERGWLMAQAAGVHGGTT
jgi:8-oxo-dGTP diphosphatase